jgi:hypothetical protein
MSASDAAPLPRLGEVFFDVRGSSRSMRLSWYADTGVAVFSIWQGGKCTGTFRLPMGDLTRMIEILERGPQGVEPADGGERGGQESGYYEADYGHAQDDRYREPDYGPGEYRESGYGEPGPGPSGYGEAGYGEPGYRDSGHRTEGYGYADYGSPDHDQAAPGPRAAQWQEDGRYQPDVTGQRSVATDETGYGQQRFVPPYVRAQPDSSQAGYSDDSEYRPPADPRARRRHSAGRHSSGEAQ